jgi:fumarate hydratase subunit beta
MSLKLKTPLSEDQTGKLRIGDIVYISGTIYTARDSAHKRMVEEGAPVDLKDAVIFHAGPIIRSTDAGHEMVAVGPTTSMRMSPYEPEVIKMGVKAIIGKGGMDEATAQAIKENNAVYFTAVGGCAAHYVKSVLRIKSVHWEDLGVPEAVWELEVRDFGPLLVTMDSEGGNLYTKVKEKINVPAEAK